MKWQFFGWGLLFFLVACTGTSTVTQTELPVPSTVTMTSELAPPPTAIIAPTLAPGPTNTPDSRLPPEQWQEWPVVPAATGRSIEIYRKGLTLGNDPSAFSKIGDCQNVKAAFMGFFDIPERYDLGLDFQYLQETIDHFSGHFNTDGQAVRGGFNAATVLSPLWANPEVCLAGETPLDCELRITKPSIVFISFEVWWEGRTAEAYEEYMRTIIETVIAQGTIPILATKADNVEGDHSLNLATARLAHEYDLPLWNFWLAVQPLPYHGLDPVRNDGFHISTEGWNVRSFTGLQALDSIWRGVRDLTGSESFDPTPSPISMTSPLPLPTSGFVPGLMNQGEKLLLGLGIRQGGKLLPNGVLFYEPDANTSTQLLGSGWDFQDASPNGQFFLVNFDSALYLTDGNDLKLLSSELYPYGELTAFFFSDDQVIFISTEPAGNSLVLADLDGTVLKTLSPPGANPILVHPSTDGTRTTWETGTCSGYRVCDSHGAWLTDLQTGETHSLTGMVRPLLAPAGSAMAYAYMAEGDKSNLAFASADGMPTRPFPLVGDSLDAFAWDSYGLWLAVHLSVRSDYSGRIIDGLNYLVSSKDFSTRQLPSTLLLNPLVLWSPDESSLALLGTDWMETHYAIRFYEVGLDTGRIFDLTTHLNLASDNYLFITNGAWMGSP